MMSDASCDSVYQFFHEINSQIVSCLERLFPECGSAVVSDTTYSDISKVLCILKDTQNVPALDLQRAGDSGKREIARFQKHLECLSQLLPTLHVRLLQEHVRLEQDNARLHAASEWNKRSRQTL